MELLEGSCIAFQEGLSVFFLCAKKLVDRQKMSKHGAPNSQSKRQWRWWHFGH